MIPVSLTGLTLVPDETLSPTEVRVHPDMVERIGKAFFEADAIRSLRQPKVRIGGWHPFSSVGDGDDAA